jgi:4-hydroxy-3-methylbut-2-en-1-yl diphosphate reductase
MKIILADAFGMCFGVRDALRAVVNVQQPKDATIHGELVHNEVVLHQLAARGFQQTREAERDELPQTPSVLITAHGISNRRRQTLLAANKQLIDTTCPLVRRAHETAQQLAESDFHVLVLGKAGHVEVQGIVEDLDSHTVIGHIDDVRTFPHARLGIVCQTTLPPVLADELVRCIRQCNPASEIIVCDTICEPTRRRQQALEKLVTQVQAVVVVGGKHSNNTLQLVAFCEARGVPTLHVTCAAELDAAWLAQFSVVGLTAGTSTLDETVGDVFRAIKRLSPQLNEQAPQSVRE